MAVEASVDDSTVEAMWVHVSEVWEALGRREPMWSVLTDRRYLASSQPSAAVVAGFYDSGRGDRDYLISFLERAGLSPTDFPVVAEYGCGIGRTTRWLAASFESIRAFDISASHLAKARDHIRESGLSNVTFIHVLRRESLSQLAGVDLFFSIIVLQHNPPPVILDILDHAFAGLNPGGVACFQVPTYSTDYRFTVESYWQRTAIKKSMERHFVPQADIFRLAERHGMSVLEVRQDHCLGFPETTISNTFILRKKCV